MKTSKKAMCKKYEFAVLVGTLGRVSSISLFNNALIVLGVLRISEVSLGRGGHEAD